MTENATTVKRFVRYSDRKIAMYRRAARAMELWRNNTIPRTNRLRAENIEIRNEETFWNGFPGEDQISVNGPSWF